MYKTNNSFKSKKITKEDLLELELGLRKNFSSTVDFFSINIDTPSRTIQSKVSMEEIFKEKIENRIDSISLNIATLSKGSTLFDKLIKVYISFHSITYHVEGNDEIWVHGISKYLDSFFGKRKSVLAKLTSFIPFIGGGLIGGNISILATTSKSAEPGIVITSAILLLLGLIISVSLVTYRSYFPNVRISLKPKEKKDIVAIFTIVGAVATVLTLIVTLIAIWI